MVGYWESTFDLIVLGKHLEGSQRSWVHTRSTFVLLPPDISIVSNLNDEADIWTLY
jgi:hypothetical protein